MEVVEVGYKQTEVGLIPDDWEVKSLQELFEITSSKRVFQNEWRDKGIPFYRARELAVLAGKGSVDNDLFIEPSMYHSYKATYGVPQIGDVLVTGVGTLGKVYVVRDDTAFYFKDGNIIWLKNQGDIESGFLHANSGHTDPPIPFESDPPVPFQIDPLVPEQIDPPVVRSNSTLFSVAFG